MGQYRPSVTVETMQQICIVCQASQAFCLLTKTTIRVICSASSERKVATPLVPPASWQLASGKSVAGLLPPFRSVLVETMNPESQADDLALEEESPFL
jgi:hypothetical protein